VRANLAITFTEFLDPELDKRQTDPELTTRILKPGDTLSSIAAEVYRDPRRWRIIAEANRLDDPRNLQSRIGQRLTIPKL
jgi:nucleoid-associated protein YgaU